MFAKNKYTRWYFNIIDNAKSRTISDYTERHHIVPKALGGSNKKDNLVQLTAREHFVCHLLLAKMTDGENKKKMSYALWLMCNMKNTAQMSRNTPTSITYDRVRKSHSKMLSDTLTGVKKNYSSFGGKKHSEETLRHFSEVKMGSKNPNYGVEQKPEWNKAKSDAQIGVSKPILVCERCNQEVGGHGNYKRWHGVNCKKERVLI